MTACSFSAKLSPAKAGRSVANSSALTGSTVANRINANAAVRTTQTLTRLAAPSDPAPCHSLPRSRGRARVGVGEVVTAAVGILTQSVYLGAVQLPQTQGQVQSASFALSSGRYG